jgi:hypothetical protein
MAQGMSQAEARVAAKAFIKTTAINAVALTSANQGVNAARGLPVTPKTVAEDYLANIVMAGAPTRIGRVVNRPGEALAGAISNRRAAAALNNRPVPVPGMEMSIRAGRQSQYMPVELIPVKGEVVQVTNDAIKNDRTPNSNSSQGIGTFKQSSKKGDWITVKLPGGREITVRRDDTVPGNRSGRYNPNGRENDFALNDTPQPHFDPAEARQAQEALREHGKSLLEQVRALEQEGPHVTRLVRVDSLGALIANMAKRVGEGLEQSPPRSMPELDITAVSYPCLKARGL